MIAPPRLGRRGPEVLRSQLALEVALVTYSGVTALLLTRVLFKIAAVSPLAWSGSTVYALSDPLLFPFRFVAPASRPVFAGATLGEITLLGFLALLPLALSIRHRPA